MGLKINYNNPLPDIYEREMPQGLSPIDKHDWRKHKIVELRRAGLLIVDDNGSCTFINVDQEVPVETPAVAIDVSATANQSDITVASNVVEKNETRKLSITRKSVNKTESKLERVEFETTHHIPKSVMDALRSLFPCSASKADLVSAAVYIVTNGACEISDKAMELVESYKSDDKLISINERLSRLERATKIQTTLLQSIELCTCFNTFDRRYGSTQPRKGPKNTDFREQDNLDMLECLREQAVDQQRIDELERGRQIYNQTKDKND